MKRNVSLITEYLWLRGQLEDFPARQRLARLLHVGLRHRNPDARSLPLGENEILSDIETTLRVLQYGGRRPQEVSPERQKFLNHWYGQFSLAAA